MAPIITHLIDRMAYKNVDARRRVHETISAELDVVDLCCGVAFSSVKGATCVDTSKQMLGVARLRRPDAKFIEGNAETFGKDNAYDVATVMFAMHEMPREGRRRVLANAMVSKSLPTALACPSS
jgi:ubiquinone/menaquinone biosynthesis C-methylase UbiE